MRRGHVEDLEHGSLHLLSASNDPNVNDLSVYLEDALITVTINVLTSISQMTIFTCCPWAECPSKRWNDVSRGFMMVSLKLKKLDVCDLLQTFLSLSKRTCLIHLTNDPRGHTMGLKMAMLNSSKLSPATKGIKLFQSSKQCLKNHRNAFLLDQKQLKYNFEV